MSITILRVQFRDPVSFAGSSKSSIDFVEKDRWLAATKVSGGIQVTAPDKPKAFTLFVPDANIISMTFSPAEEPKKVEKTK